jgi:hypothetical protein
LMDDILQHDSFQSFFSTRSLMLPAWDASHKSTWSKWYNSGTDQQQAPVTFQKFG